MANNWPTPTDDEPTIDELESWMLDIEFPRATDGCEPMESDGVCQHGHPSWMIIFDLA